MTTVTALAMVGIAVIVTVAALHHGFIIAVITMKGRLMAGMAVGGGYGLCRGMMSGMAIGLLMNRTFFTDLMRGCGVSVRWHLMTGHSKNWVDNQACYQHQK
ncbi:hypothetical protein PTW35_04590 [Photobacterium sp. DA100]|uniref:hypothetical protein n=1 Tax=Photobacterium sp. DA100 TaxID=3027472 RepID=UPI002478EA8C|nr:hypothetical protein [Photobacterium sp. DA100]WEM43082.1 hypothetical protein PTW35_04590 [Photobacterium sp. DA100]